MQRFMWVLDFVFGCHHRHLSRVFTLDGRTYRVCCDCGANFAYSLANMSMGQRAKRFEMQRIALQQNQAA